MKCIGKVRELLVAGVIALGVLVATSSAALAKDEFHYWGSESAPLIVTGYGSTGKAYGAWRVTDGSTGTRAWNDGKGFLINADNHKIYIKQRTLVNAGICIAPKYTSCSQAYYEHEINDTEARSNVVNTWVDLKSSTSVSANADYARGAMSVCLDIPLRKDPCVGEALTNGTKY